MVSMHRKSSFALALVLGALAGGLAVKMLSPPSAYAQAGSFAAVAVAATQSGSSTFAWFVGRDGSARVCSYGTPARCAPVQF